VVSAARSIRGPVLHVRLVTHCVWVDVGRVLRSTVR
jgi:hypothetical protein